MDKFKVNINALTPLPRKLSKKNTSYLLRSTCCVQKNKKI